MLRIVMLGRMQVRRPDGQAPPESVQPKRFALLAYLGLEGDRRPVRREQLRLLFWPRLDGAAANGALRQALHHLRQLGEEIFVERNDTGLRVAEGAVRCDVRELEAAWKAGDPRRVLELYGGPFLPGARTLDVSPAFDHWLDTERSRFERLMLDAVHRLVAEARAAGDEEAELAWLRKAAVLAPTSEPTARELMRTLRRQGWHAEALEAFERLSASLALKLGLRPSPRTRALGRWVERGAPPHLRSSRALGGRGAGPPPRAEDASAEAPIAAVLGDLVRADGLSALGRYEEARRLVERFLRSAELTPSTRALAEFRLADIHDRLGNRSEAAERLRRFTSLWRNLDPNGHPQAGQVERFLRRFDADGRGRLRGGGPAERPS